MITTAEWVSIGGALVTLGALGVQAVYLRGKIDGGSTAESRSQKRGLEAVCTDIDRHDDELRTIRDLAVKASTSLDNHVDQCGDRYRSVETAFERVHDRLDEIFRSLGNLATGRNAMYRVQAARTPAPEPEEEGTK